MLYTDLCIYLPVCCINLSVSFIYLCTVFTCVVENRCPWYFDHINLCTVFTCVLYLSVFCIYLCTIFICVLYLCVYFIYLCTIFTCVAENRCPWYLLMTVNCLTSLSSNQATGVRKSRGLARPLAPTEN